MNTCRILALEPHQWGRDLAAEQIAALGHQGTVAANWDEVLRTLAWSDFDVLILGLYSDGPGALQAMKVLQQREKETGKHIRVLAQAEFWTDEDVAEGIDAYLPAPVTLAALREQTSVWQVHP